MAIRVSRSLTIPDGELRFTFSPSGGPGGQHANKASTRVTLEWDVDGSEALGPRQKAKVMDALARRIDSAGILRMSSDARRSQLRNRADVEGRLAQLVADALRPTKRRVATQPSDAAKRRRVESKRRRSAIKRARGRPALDD